MTFIYYSRVVFFFENDLVIYSFVYSFISLV